MIDGIKLFQKLNDFDNWRKTVNINFYTPIDKNTGEIKDSQRIIKGLSVSTIKHTAKFENYFITVKETVKRNVNGCISKSYFMIISGSLHKNYFGGQNYSPFTFDNLQVELLKIEKELNITFNLTNLVNIEIGVNIVTPFEVLPFLKRNLLSYKGYSFSDYMPDRDGFILGKYCKLSQYSIKIYDKGKQYNLPYNLMRYEVRFTKMSIIKGMNVKTLNSLKTHLLVYDLISILVNTWKKVLIYDNSINITDNEIRVNHRRLLINGNNPKYWEELKCNDKRAFNYQRALFKQLVNKYGVNLHGQILELIKNEWLKLSCSNYMYKIDKNSNSIKLDYVQIYN